MKELIAKRYIKALFQVASQKEIETYLKTLNEIKNAFSSEKFLEIIESPSLSVTQKEGFLLSLVDSKADKKLVNFLRILAQKNRIELIPQVCREIESELASANKKYSGYVLCNSKLSNDVMSALSNGISKKVNADIKLEQKNSDIDGILLRVEDLGIEVGFSKERLKSSLTEHILKAI